MRCLRPWPLEERPREREHGRRRVEVVEERAAVERDRVLGMLRQEVDGRLGLEDAPRLWVPDAHIGDDRRIFELFGAEHARFLDRPDVVLRQVEEQRLDVLRRAPERVLQGPKEANDNLN